MIRFNCEKCGQRYKTDDDLAGEEIECSKCGTAVHIPNDIIPPMQKTTVESGKTEEFKMPSLSLSSSIRGKINETKKTEDSKTVPPPLSLPEKMLKKESEKAVEEEAGNCPKCDATLRSANAVICIECGNNLKTGVNAKTLKNAKVAGKLGLAIAVGAAAALLSGGIWAAIAVATKMEIGWIACLVGLVSGMAVCLVTKERSSRIGSLAVILACVGLLTGKMLTAEYLIRDTFDNFGKMVKKFSESNKKIQDMVLMGMLAEEMLVKGEINTPDNEELEKLAPKDDEKPSKAYQDALKKIGEQSKQNMAKVKKKFSTLSAEDKGRLQKNLERIALIFPLQQEMIDNGEIPKPDDDWKDLAPKNFTDKPSKEYLAALGKFTKQTAENMKKVKKKLYTLSDAEAERLQGKIGSTFASQISYWQKLKMVTSYWDILWFMLAISTAWKLGAGTSAFSRQGI